MKFERCDGASVTCLMFVTSPKVRVPSSWSASTMSNGFAISFGASQKEKRSEALGSRSVADAFPMIWPVSTPLAATVGASSSSNSLTISLPLGAFGRKREPGRPPHACLEGLHRDEAIFHGLFRQVDRVQVCVPPDVLAMRGRLTFRH